MNWLKHWFSRFYLCKKWLTWMKFTILINKDIKTVRFATETEAENRSVSSSPWLWSPLSEMAPKKKPQKQNNNSKKKSNSNSSSSSSSSSGPRLQISAENENRLRRLLLNTARPAQPAANPAQDTLSKAQKAKKLKAVYEKLSCEGFSNEQIELVLSSLKVSSDCYYSLLFNNN